MKLISGLIEGLKASYSMPIYTLSKQPEWYLSNQGKKVYKRLNALPLKIRFFYGYFLSLRKGDFVLGDDKLFSLSMTMVYALELSLLECRDYVEVFDVTKNPFVAFVKSKEYGKNRDYDDYEGKLINSEYDIAIAKLIAYVHNTPEEYRKYLCKTKADLDIAYYNLTDKDEDIRLYKLERLIIWSFRQRSLGGATRNYPLYGPYKYLTTFEVHDIIMEDIERKSGAKRKKSRNKDSGDVLEVLADKVKLKKFSLEYDLCKKMPSPPPPLGNQVPIRLGTRWEPSKGYSLKIFMASLSYVLLPIMLLLFIASFAVASFNISLGITLASISFISVLVIGFCWIGWARATMYDFRIKMDEFFDSLKGCSFDFSEDKFEEFFETCVKFDSECEEFYAQVISLVCSFEDVLSTIESEGLDCETTAPKSIVIEDGEYESDEADDEMTLSEAIKIIVDEFGEE